MCERRNVLEFVESLCLVKLGNEKSKHISITISIIMIIDFIITITHRY